MSTVKTGTAPRVHRKVAPETTWQEWISEARAVPNVSRVRPQPSSGNGAAVRPAADPQAAHETIARLAYANWEARGCPHGSPEADWLLAEQQFLQAGGF